MKASKEKKQIEKAPNASGQEDNLKEQIQHLSKAFELFSSETARLEKAYTALKTKFNSVNQKLAERTESLNQKIHELDAVSDYMHQILSNISQGILFIKPDGLITTYNAYAEQILEISGDLVLFKSALNALPDQIFGFSLAEALEKKQAPETGYPTIESELSGKKHLEVNATFLNQDKGIPGLLLVIRDITSFKQLQSIANRNDRLQDLGEMAAAVAHEIRNPLGGIEGFASLLTRDLNDQPKLKKMAENIVSGSRTLNHLVSQVLNYARPIQMQLKNAAINEVTSESIELFKADPMTPKSLKVKLNEPDGILVAPIDRNILKRAILNILINASHSMPDGGIIEVTIEKVDGFASLSISDKGHGISEANIDRIFSPFFTTKDDGNGFGLAEVHKIIQAHQGEIAVKSELNQGSTFTIQLPLNQEKKLWL